MIHKTWMWSLGVYGNSVLIFFNFSVSSELFQNKLLKRLNQLVSEIIFYIYYLSQNSLELFFFSILCVCVCVCEEWFWIC